MKIQQVTKFVIVILLFNSCNTKKHHIVDDEFINKVVVTSNPDKIYMAADIFHHISAIELETTPENLIGEIHKIIISKNHLFILDRAISKAVFSFDINGNYNNIIGSQGKGPGEYLSPQDMIVDENKQMILIYCQTTKKILYYSFSGKFIKEIKTNLTFKSFEFLNNDTITCFAHGIFNSSPKHRELPYNLMFFDSLMNIFKPQFFNNTSIGIGKTIMTKNKYFSKYDGYMYLNWLFNDTIYKIDNKCHVTPYLLVDFGNKKVSLSMHDKLSDFEILKKIANGEKSAIINSIQIANKKMVLEFASKINEKDPNSNYKILFDMESKESLFFKDIMISKSLICPFPIGTTSNDFISVLFPEYLSKADYLSLVGTDKILRKSNNPILLFYDIKNFQDIKNK